MGSATREPRGVGRTLAGYSDSASGGCPRERAQLVS